MAGLLQKWGLGAELEFRDGRARVAMGRTLEAVRSLRSGLVGLSQQASQAFGGLGQAGLAIAPIAAGAGLLLRRATQLASTFEQQQQVMRLLVGDVGQADALLASLVQRASTTPFAQGDLIEGSKRLLRLTGQNVDQNLELMDLMMTMAALNPTKNVTDAVEALLDATSGGGFERLKEFGVTLRAADFQMQAGEAGFAEAVTGALMDAIQRQTRGADVVGALGQTFSGRMSSLVDAVDNALRPLGERINARLGPAIEQVIAFLDGSRDKFVQAVDAVIAKGDELWTRFGRPFVRRVRAAWEALGTEGQVALLTAGAGVAALVTALAPLASALGVVGFAVSGIASAVSAVASVGLSAELLPLAAVAVVVAAAVGMLAAALISGFAQPGESAMQTVTRVLAGFVEQGRALWTEFGPGLSDLAVGFAEAFGGDVSRMVRELGVQLYALIGSAMEFIAVLAPDQAAVSYWRTLGRVIGHIAAGPFVLLGEALKFVVAVLDIGRSMMEPFLAAVIALAVGFGSLVDGSMTFGQAFTFVMQGLAGVIVGFFNIFASAFLGVAELIMRAVSVLIAAYPGLSALLGIEGSFGADAIAQLRRSLSRQLTEATLGVDLAAGRRDAAAADAAAAPVVVDDQRTTEVAVTTSVAVDSQEVARATGASAVRASERGIGPPLAAPARGRVLRGGLEVSRLSPTEVP